MSPFCTERHYYTETTETKTKVIKKERRNKIDKKIIADRLKKFLSAGIKTEVNRNLTEMNPDKISLYTNRFLSLDGTKISISQEEIKKRADLMISKYYKEYN